MKKKFNKIILYAIIAAAIVFGVLICLFIDVIKKYAIYICIGIFVVGLFIYELVLRSVEKKELKKQEADKQNANSDTSNAYAYSSKANESDLSNSNPCESVKEENQNDKGDNDNDKGESGEKKDEKPKKKYTNNFSLFLTPDEVEKCSKVEIAEPQNDNQTKEK